MRIRPNFALELELWGRAVAAIAGVNEVRVGGFAGPVIAAASKTLPLGSVVRVTNLENGRSVDVKVNDRGPRAPRRNLDLSPEAAQKLIVAPWSGSREDHACE